jgi:hypothetical protein
MKKLIRDATIHYEIRNLTTNRRTGAVAPSKKLFKKAKIEKVTTVKDVEEAQYNERLLKEIAIKHKKKVEDIDIKITGIQFGKYSSWSNDVY